MSAPSDRLEHALAAHVAARETVVVDAREGKKRWLLYFEEGALVGSKSNLKSEGLERLAEQKPDMAEDKLVVLQAVRRLRNAMKGATEWSAKAGTTKERQPVDTGYVLVKALSGVREAGELAALCADLLDTSWSATEALDGLALGGTLTGWLAEASGDDGAALLARAPGKAAEAHAALWLAVMSGGIVPAGAEEAEAEAEAEPEGLPDGLGDLSSLIAAGVAAVQEQEAYQIAPTEDASLTGFVPDQAPKNPANAIDFADDIGIEPLGADGEVVAPPPKLDIALPTFTKREAAVPAEPEPPPRHPLEDQLRALHARLMGAETHFEVFELEWDAGEDAFRTAHLELARQLHPDRYADGTDEVQDLANEAFDRVRAAWEVLGEEEARGAYIDRIVHGKKSDDELAMEQVEAFWKAESDFKRGLALFNQGRMKQAHELFTKAHQTVPEELEFKAYYAFTQFKQVSGRDEEAAEAAKEMLKDVLDKNKEQERKLDGAWVLMGILYRDIGNEAAAKKCLVRALKLNPSNADAQRELRRVTGQQPGQKKAEEKKSSGGFFSRLFGGKK